MYLPLWNIIYTHQKRIDASRSELSLLTVSHVGRREESFERHDSETFRDRGANLHVINEYIAPADTDFGLVLTVSCTKFKLQVVHDGMNFLIGLILRVSRVRSYENAYSRPPHS